MGAEVPTQAALVRGWLPVLSVMACLMGVGCHSKDELPKRSSPAYAQFVTIFYQGLAALQVGDDVRAESSLSEATRLAPGEPAGWVDWGVLALRQRSYDSAAERLDRARKLAPKNDQIDYLLGLLESERGNSAAAIAHLQDAVQIDPRNLRALYQLASEIEREGDASSDQRFEQLMQQILAVDPGNLAALLELIRAAAKRGDGNVLRQAVAQIASRGKDWPPEVAQQLAQLQGAAAGPDPRIAATRSIFLRNVLMRRGSAADDAVSSIGEPSITSGACGSRHQLCASVATSERPGKMEVGRCDSSQRTRRARDRHGRRPACTSCQRCDTAISRWEGVGCAFAGGSARDRFQL
jgi:hypothetical protein